MAEHNEGMKVSSLYIGQIKKKMGLEKRKNYNIGSGEGRHIVAPRSKYNSKYPDSRIRGEFICPVCDETPATQNDNLIEFDSNRYTVRVLPQTTYGKEQLKRIAAVCGCNFIEAKNILEGNGKTFPAMDALDTRALKEKLDSMEIRILLYLVVFLVVLPLESDTILLRRSRSVCTASNA